MRSSGRYLISMSARAAMSAAGARQAIRTTLGCHSLIDDEFGRWRHGRDAKLRSLAIIDDSGRQEQDARAVFLVADGLELGVASAFRAADIMSQGPISRRPHNDGPCCRNWRRDFNRCWIKVQWRVKVSGPAHPRPCQRTANVFPDATLRPAHKAIRDCSASSRSVEIGAVGSASTAFERVDNPAQNPPIIHTFFFTADLLP